MEQLLEDFAEDKGGACLISKSDFRMLVQTPTARSIMQDVGVDAKGMMEFVDTIFDSDLDGEEKKLTLSQFANELFELSDTNTVEMRDIVGLRKYIKLLFQEFESKVLGWHGL